VPYRGPEAGSPRKNIFKGVVIFMDWM